MLVLSRKSSQQIMIGPDIQVTIVKIDRNQVRIGIQAPPGISILRQELAGVPRAAASTSAPTRPTGPVPIRNRRVPGLND
jgi:carbon storage regulator